MISLLPTLYGVDLRKGPFGEAYTIILIQNKLDDTISFHKCFSIFQKVAEKYDDHVVSILKYSEISLIRRYNMGDFMYFLLDVSHLCSSICIFHLFKKWSANISCVVVRFLSLYNHKSSALLSSQL